MNPPAAIATPLPALFPLALIATAADVCADGGVNDIPMRALGSDIPYPKKYSFDSCEWDGEP